KSQSENLMNELKQQMTGQIGRILQQSGAAGAVRSGSSSLRTPELTMPSVTFKLEVPQSRFIYLNGSDTMTAFDSIAAMMMGFFIFFFVFLIAGVSFLHERISGTMERLLATPIRRHEIVMGYFIGFGIFVVAQTLLIQLFMVYALHIPLKGNFLLVLLVNVLLASGSLSLGTFLSAFARNEFQMIQFIPIVIVPQILFCGLFDLRAAPLWVTVLSKLFPLTYGADALNSIALRGMGVSSIANDLAVMGVFTVLFLILNTLALKRYRKI
ncbi:MAG TPA: ABC transporter permease, partial [Clostridia bacterium]|nr:ABC transporter permease [Clostridia bacterium]